MNIKNLINELIGRGFSTDAATILGNRFPFYKSNEIYDVASEGTKEELVKLCKNDSDLLDREKDESRPNTWDYIGINYDVIELGNGNFIIISSHQQ